MDAYRFLVLLLLALPAAAAVGVALLGPGRARLVRQVSLGVTLAGVAIALVLAAGFLAARSASPLPTMSETKNVETFRPELVPGATAEAPHRTTWNLINLGRGGAIQFYLGLDGLNVWLIVLTAILMVTAVLISWTSIEERVHEFHAWLLALGTAMFGVFLAFDIVLFYVFFELTLVPLFFLIGIWGGPERRYAARKFFIYTLAGSVITLLGVLAVVVVTAGDSGNFTFSIPDLVRSFNQQLVDSGSSQAAYWQTVQFWVFLAMMVGFAIKVPLFPVHTWLPLAHVEAPTAGSVLLAGVLLKLGTYGFMRLTLPLAPDAAVEVGLPLIGTLSVIGILYGAFCARAQDDIKKLVAYSSVSHLGFCTLGLFALNTAGITGGLMQMINHGLSTGGLFLIVGMLYERYHTRMIQDYSGIANKLGLLSAAMVFVCLSSVGLPGLNGFIGEGLVFFGMYAQNPAMAILGTGGIILGAWYLFTMLRAVFFGPLREPHVHAGHHGVTHTDQGEGTHGEHAQLPVRDLTGREIATLAPILALCLLLGVYPQPVIDSVEPDVRIISEILQKRQAHLEARAAEPAGPAAVAQAPTE